MPEQRGVGDELWVWLATDPADGVTGVGYMRTAGSASLPLVAESKTKAQALRPIVVRLADITNVSFTLVKFSCREDVDRVDPPT